MSLSSSKTTIPPIKKLSPDEMKRRCDQVLCYNCDEKFIPSHWYKSQTLFQLGATGEEQEESNPEREDHVAREANLTLHVHAMSSSVAAARTMKVKARIHLCWLDGRKL